MADTSLDDHGREEAEVFVVVHGSWDGWRTALVRAHDLFRLHWHCPAGAPGRILHAFIECTGIVRGRVEHDCEPARVPHTLRVCILKSHAASAVYDRLAQLADAPQTAAARQTMRPLRTAYNTISAVL